MDLLLLEHQGLGHHEPKVKKTIDRTDKEASSCLMILGSSMALGTKTGFPVLATWPTIPSSDSRISEFKTFSMKRARGVLFFIRASFNGALRRK